MSADELVLDVATAPHKKSPSWTQGTIAWPEILAWADTPAAHKDCGSYVLGRIIGTEHVKNETIVSRSAITLDADSAEPDLPDQIKGLGCLALVHTTFSSAPDALRFRCLLPTDRNMTPGETRRCTAVMIHKLGEHQFDSGSVQPARLMHKPSAQKPEWFQSWPFEGDPLCVDELLAEADELLPEADETAPPVGDLSHRVMNPAWVAAKLRGVWFELSVSPEGSRNDRLNAVAYSLGRLVARDHLTEEEVRDTLTEAALDAGLEPAEIEGTLDGAILAGRKVPRDPPAPGKAEAHAEGAGRRIVLTSAADIKPRPVFWLWAGRLALGTLGLLAGREGLGKSTLGYWLAARITKGALPGHYQGTPKGVLVCATEDSWEHTIVPRLMAAGADLSRVYRVDVLNADNIHVGMALPRDLRGVERAARQTDAALLLLDPLMSRLPDLDTHKDAEVRLALEPLVALADRTNMGILGLIHHNKSGSADPLQLVMASKAFTAVARSVHTVMLDPEDDTESRRLFGTPKNNLGRTDLPTLSFTIAGYDIDTDEGVAWTGQLVWGEEQAASIGDSMRRAAAHRNEDRSATAEATAWLWDYMADNGGRVLSAEAKKDAKTAGHKDDALRRARQKLHLKSPGEGFPRVTYWETPDTEGEDAP